jgi:peptidyl-prolyl cis-trans isomerase C
MRRPARLLAAFLLSAGPALAQTPPAAPATAPENPVVARVDGTEIRLSDVQEEAGRLPAELRAMPPPMLFPLLLDQMITQRALVTAARAAGLDRDAEVIARIKRAEEETLQQILITRAVAAQVTEEALRARFTRDAAARPVEEEVRASHILVPTEAEARAALADARRPGADFAAVARARSTGPGSREGGDLGFFKRGDMIPEFAEAAFALQPGEISPAPVRTQFGWHIIRVTERRAAPAPGFEEAKEALRQTVFEEAVNAEVERIRAAARIERFNMDGSRPAAPSLLDGAAPPAPAPQPRR